MGQNRGFARAHRVDRATDHRSSIKDEQRGKGKAIVGQPTCPFLISCLILTDGNPLVGGFTCLFMYNPSWGWWFLMSNFRVVENTHQIHYVESESSMFHSVGAMDCWIIHYIQSILRNIRMKHIQLVLQNPSPNHPQTGPIELPGRGPSKPGSCGRSMTTSKRPTRCWTPGLVVGLPSCHGGTPKEKYIKKIIDVGLGCSPFSTKHEKRATSIDGNPDDFIRLDGYQ